MATKPECGLILLVEDNPADVRAVTAAMQAIGFDADLLVARTGREALDLMKKLGKPGEPPVPDLILLDLGLPIPGPDGRDVLAEFKGDAALRAVPVLILANSTDPGDVSLCYQLGANAYVPKPASAEEYKSLLERIR